MKNHGFVRIAAAIPLTAVGDCEYNARAIKRLIDQSVASDVQVVCFPELSVTGYTCGDLFHQQLLTDEAEMAVSWLLEGTCHSDIIFIVGVPVSSCGKLFNAAVVCQGGRIAGIVPKTFLPNHNEFCEKRWFASALDTDQARVSFCGKDVPFGTGMLFGNDSFAIGVELCEDLWAPVPPSSKLALDGAHIIFNLSANNELSGKNDYVRALVRQQSARCIAGYIYASSGCGESTTDLVFSGNGIICENGIILAQSERFSFNEQLIVSEIDVERLKADRQRNSSFIRQQPSSFRFADIRLPDMDNLPFSRKINALPFVPDSLQYHARCEEIFSIQVGGLSKRLVHTGITTSVIGISGGLDSTLALLVCARTYDKLQVSRKGIVGVTMPGYGTTERTYNNAMKLMQSLGITIMEIDITASCNQHFKDIGHDPAVHDVTFENIQARERTQILMDIANQMNGLVIGTGDMSELALGWTTYNGDHMSMYGINSSIPKTLVRHLVKWASETQVDRQSGITLTDILDTPVSPELLPADENGKIAQCTEDIIGPYELHDFFLYYMIRFGFTPGKIFFLAQHAFTGIYTGDDIQKWMKVFYRRFFNQQFKRSCMPDGPKVGSVNLSPRGDWRMPSDASVASWLKGLSFKEPG